MLQENLRRLRRAKGLSQEELADRLHVVRQTVSKWEQGRSVPDADALLRIADIFETPVGALLGGEVALPRQESVVAQKLEQLNALLAQRNKRGRRIWHIVLGVLIACVVLLLLQCMAGVAAHRSYQTATSTVEQIQP